MNARKVFNWNTEFDSTGRTMIHTFSERIKVVTDFSAGTISSFKDGNRIDKIEFGSMTLSGYEKYLITVAESAEKVNSFSNE